MVFSFKSDNKPYSGTSYYRLKQVDKNGAYKYAPMAKVNFSTPSFLSAYPNPCNGSTTIYSDQDIDELKVVDMLGQIVYEENSHAKKITLQLNKEGSYFVTVTCGQEVSMKKLVVLK